MTGRSPRYPRHGLSKSLEFAKKLFDGVHRSKVDTDTAAKVIGYTNSSSGAAAGALGALRQFGLVDGLRGSMSVSDLTLRILQPLDSQEKLAALREAAGRPEIFGKVLSHFGSSLPSSDEPIRALLIRNQGFSQSGADELISVLRETVELVSEEASFDEAPVASEGPAAVAERGGQDTRSAYRPPIAQPALPVEEEGELIVLPLGAGSKAELRMIGAVNAASFGRLIRHLELLRDMFVEDQPTDM